VFLAGKEAPQAAPAAPAATPATRPATEQEFEDEQGAVGRVIGAARRGAVEGFGNPLGQSILSPLAQSYLDDKQRQGGIPGRLAQLGSTVGTDIGTGLGIAGGAVNALFRGAQGAVAQTGEEVGAPQAGRDIAAIPEAFMGGGPQGFARVPANALEAAALRRGAAGEAAGVAGRGAPAVGARPAPDMGQAAADTVAAPLPQGFLDSPLAPGFSGQPNKLVPPTTIRVGDGTSIQIPARDAPPPAPTSPNPNLAPNRLASAEPAAVNSAVNRLAATADPQSLGAAASRDMTTVPIPEPTPAQKATALQNMVGQSAEDRLTPQGRDDNTYFPGVVRPEAMRDFTPAPEGEMSSALEHKALYNTDSNYHDRFDAQVKNNNNIMTDGLRDMFGDANARDAAMDEARKLMPGSVNLFDGEKPRDIQPVADTINKILAGSKGKIDGIANSLNKILPKLYDADGKPETMPSMIKGIFDDVNNKLYDKSPTVEGNEARQASDQLKQVKAALSDVIGSGLPGTKWQDYLTNLSGALGRVNKLDYMQQFLTGPKKLWGNDGMLQFNKVQKMLEDIQKHTTDQTGGARQMTMPEINLIEAARNELAAKDLLDKRAGVRGSPTVQLANASGGLGSGPLGAGIKGAAEAALHMGLAATTGPIGNAALGGYRFIVKPAVQAAKAQKAANALTATKNRLLSTDLSPNAQP
jgi:hypothetical protein